MKNTTRLGLFVLMVGTVLILISCTTSKSEGAIDKSNYDTLYLQFEADRTLAQAGKPIQMRFTVKNTGEHPWILESPDTPVMDIVVEGEDRRVLLAWSSQNPDQVSHRLEWKPGEAKIIELTWVPKQEDLRFGVYYDIFLSGRLSENAKFLRGASVRICASNFCLPPR